MEQVVCAWMLLATTAVLLSWPLMKELVIGATGAGKNNKPKNQSQPSYHAAAEVQPASFCK